MAKTKSYRIEDSAFYRIRNLRWLAELLQINAAELKKIVRDKEKFYWCEERIIGKKTRTIQCPIGIMDRLHKRIKKLLDRLERPHFLHSPKPGASYITNAVAHASMPCVFQADIVKFYPSTDPEHVFRFFKYVAECSDEISGLMAKLCTLDNQLPFGSCLSPILGYHVHRNLFLEINTLCSQEDLRMTLYVDNITISGASVPGSVIFAIKKLIRQSRLRYHECRRTSMKKNPVITGIQLLDDQPAPANKTHIKIKLKLEELNRTAEPENRYKLLESLLGYTNHGLTVYPDHSPAYLRLLKRKQWICNERTRLKKVLQLPSEMRSCL